MSHNMDMEISLLAAILHDRFTQAKVVD